MHQFFTFGTIFCNKKDTENETKKKTQMEKDFELIKHDGLFYEYLEMGKETE